MSDIDCLVEFMQRHPRTTVLSGAGCSTHSGIPDYRDDEGNWKNPQPVQYRDFVSSADVRKRYWARSFAGWRRISSATPNAAHDALVALAEMKFLVGHRADAPDSVIAAQQTATADPPTDRTSAEQAGSEGDK